MMPSAARLAHGAFEYTKASNTSSAASTTVAKLGERTSIAAAPATPATISTVSARDARSAPISDRPSLLLAVRRNSACFWTRPRTQASVTTHDSANHTRSALSASRVVARQARRIAHTARRIPVPANASGTTSTAPVSCRTGSRSCREVARAVARSSTVKVAVSTSANHCTLPSR